MLGAKAADALLAEVPQRWGTGLGGGACVCGRVDYEKLLMQCCCR